MFSDSRRAGRRCLAAAVVWQTSWHHVRQSNAGLRHLDGQAMLAFVPKTIPSPFVGLAMHSRWGGPSWRRDFASRSKDRRASLAANKASAMHEMTRAGSQ